MLHVAPEAEGREIMMHPHSPSAPQLAVPGIGFPQNFSVAQDMLDSRAFETGRTIGLMLHRNRLTGSPGVRHRGSGWQPDGEKVAAASGQPEAALMYYRCGWRYAAGRRAMSFQSGT